MIRFTQHAFPINSGRRNLRLKFSFFCPLFDPKHNLYLIGSTSLRKQMFQIFVYCEQTIKKLIALSDFVLSFHLKIRSASIHSAPGCVQTTITICYGSVSKVRDFNFCRQYKSKFRIVLAFRFCVLAALDSGVSL